MASVFDHAATESGLPMVNISRVEIDSAKAAVKKLGADGYAEAVRITSHPAAVNRVRAVPGTRWLQFAVKLLIYLNRCLLVVPLIVLFVGGWKAAIAVAIIIILQWFFLLNPLQIAINYEIYARLSALDQAWAKSRKNQ